MITGRDIAFAVAADFPTFFHPHAGMNIRIGIEPAHFACVRSGSKGSRIAVSPDMAADVIDTPERLFFHLLILGHEIAHLVHRHAAVTAPTPEQAINLEFWADFYGAKAAMALFEFGPNLAPVVKRLFPHGTIFPADVAFIGEAVGILAKSVYSDHPRYPPKALRIGLAINGVTSFFRWREVTRNPIFYYSIFKRMTSAPAVQETILLYSGEAEVEARQIAEVRAMHREIQGEGAAIAPGVQPFFANLLHTTFHHTEEELAFEQDKRLVELRAYGYPV